MTEPEHTLHGASHPLSPPDDELSLYTVVRALLQYRYLIVVSGLVITVLVVGWALVGARTYTSEVAFMPQSNSGRASVDGLAGLARQLGVAVPQAEPAQSPQFYAEFLGSREILGRLLADTFSVAAEPTTGTEPVLGTLADLLRIDGEEDLIRREETLRVLAEAVSTSTTRETGIVRLKVKTPWAGLSVAVARRLIELVNEFNLETRQLNAAAESRFVQGRLGETEMSLHDAEDQLRAFLETNRQFENSPQLIFEHDRLQRQVLHQQQLSTGLQEALESARIAQVRDTPLITVVEQPQYPVYPDSRYVLLRVILGLMLGAMGGLIFGLGRDFLRKGPEGEDAEYGKFRQVWGETLADIHVWRGRLPRWRANPKGSQG